MIERAADDKFACRVVQSNDFHFVRIFLDETAHGKTELRLGLTRPAQIALF